MKTYLTIFFAFILLISPLVGFGQDLGFDELRVLNSNAEFDIGRDEDPGLATDAKGNWVLVWDTFTQPEGGGQGSTNIYYSYSNDNGTTWSQLNILNSNDPNNFFSDSEAQIATDGDGNWITVWTLADPDDISFGGDFDIFYSFASGDGTTWGEAKPLNTNALTDAARDRNAEIVALGGGVWLAVWTSYLDENSPFGADFDILYARSDNNRSTWSAPQALNNATTDEGDDFEPHLVCNNSGVCIAVWESRDSLDGSLGTDRDILYVRSENGGLSWSEPAPLNSDAATDSSSSGDSMPHIATDNNGNWVAVWDVWFVNVSHSSDDGLTWAPQRNLYRDGLPPIENDSRVVTDTKGNWVATWWTNYDLGGPITRDADLLISRSNNNGASWTFPIPLNSDAASDESRRDISPTIAADKLGNWIAVWSKNVDETQAGTNDQYDLYYSTSSRIFDTPGGMTVK
jgi:hypothetical protein